MSQIFTVFTLSDENLSSMKFSTRRDFRLSVKRAGLPESKIIVAFEVDVDVGIKS